MRRAANIERECPKCGLSVEHRQVVVPGCTAFRPKKHNAPCGAPCFGGGARGEDALRAYKNGLMHGTKSHVCRDGAP